MLAEYARNLLEQAQPPYSSTPGEDSNCRATINHYRSLVPMAQEARKSIFALTPADGAIGGHAAAVMSARDDFKLLANLICAKTDLAPLA